MQIELVDFRKVINRNEKMVIEALENLMASGRGQSYREILTIKDYQDIYALALNRLPARYAQSGTIVIGNPVRVQDAEIMVLEAFETVLSNPKE